MWSLVSLPIGQHILTPDWSSHGASWLVELWHPISWPTDLQIKIWQNYVITVEPPYWSTHTGSWLVKFWHQISQPSGLQIKIWQRCVITGEPPQFPIPACKETQIIASKGFADLNVLRYFCTELYLFIKCSNTSKSALVTSVAFSSSVTTVT